METIYPERVRTLYCASCHIPFRIELRVNSPHQTENIPTMVGIYRMKQALRKGTERQDKLRLVTVNFSVSTQTFRSHWWE